MKIKTNEVCLYGILGAMLFALKFAMSPLPNIEPVSFLLIVYAIAFGIKALYPLSIYIVLEFLIYGFGFWSIAYLYIWLILVLIAIVVSKIIKNNMHPLLWAAISGLFGLVFGALYIPLCIISGGFAFATVWWLNGLTYDIVHCVSNFIICLILFKPTTKTLLKLKSIGKIT